MMKLKSFFITIAVLAGLAIAITGGIALAAANNNVTGFAWSDMPDSSDQEKTCTNNNCGRGMGWISMNNTSDGTAIPYGVSIDQATGKWTGYGWSEYAGWIDFNPSGPYPTQNGNLTIGGVRTNMTTGQTCGWAKALAGGTPQSGGWDGWISMCGKVPVTGSNGAISQQPFGVTVALPSGTMSGYAWGSSVMGWINFSQVKVTLNPNAANVTLSANPSSLTCPASGGSSTLTWSATGIVPGSCVATGGYGFSGTLPGTSGTVPVSGLNMSTLPFSITCTTAAGYTPVPTVIASASITCTNILPLVVGCMDPAASNYNSAAQVDTNPSSCVYVCNDANADNFGAAGACTYTAYCQLPANLPPNPVPNVCQSGSASSTGPLKPIYKEN